LREEDLLFISMFFKVTDFFAGHPLSLETGQMARHSDGSIVVRYGDSVVLCTVVVEKKVSQALDFLPLSVHYQEKSFAAGKIPGGFVKREGKPSDQETLISRIIDRSLRSLFPPSFSHEIQVIVTLLSYDPLVDLEIACVIGASAAVSLSGLPFKGPMASVRVGYENSKYILNSKEKTDLDLVVSGTKEGILMVESQAYELDEEIMLGALKHGHKALLPILKMISELKEQAGKKEWDNYHHSDEEHLKKLQSTLKKMAKQRMETALEFKKKRERRSALALLKQEAIEALKSAYDESLVLSCFDELKSEIMRTRIVKENFRIGGRKPDEIREITISSSLLPRTHGSALFTRGETQALSVVTLGANSDEQVIDTVDGESKERFVFHYNFPPFAVGEVGRLSAPNRREIGHGNLAWRALTPIIERSSKNFPYAIRIVSEILESNGSSSMASVCAGSLSLMDAGVPIDTHVAGIAMGLIKQGRKSVILSDISGEEDHLGDMDFKVAGTEKGITALQMDLKITSISLKTMADALTQAKQGRLHILKCMNDAIKEPKKELSPYAPRIVVFKIQKEMIRELIGPGGRKIREICEQTKTKIDVADDGTITLFGSNQTLVAKAIDMIDALAHKPEVGNVYEGKVVKIIECGAFIQLPFGKDGMVHISEVSKERVEHITDALKIDQIVKVIVTHVDEKGKIRLSIKYAP
jgi:polyribonucleotide nucleotidyltransferase